MYIDSMPIQFVKLRTLPCCRQYSRMLSKWHVLIIVIDILEQDLLIQHTLDPMHIEWNISMNILKHLFGEKDIVACRKDMEDVNRMGNLWLRQRGNL